MSRIFLILLYIIFNINGCKRVSIKKDFYFLPWFERFDMKTAEGEMILISPEKNLSATFIYDYDKLNREIKGSIYAIFGLKVADFLIKDSGIKVYNSKGDTIGIQKIITQNIIPAEVFITFVTYHFKFMVGKDATRLKTPNGELLYYNNYNLLLKEEGGYPFKSVYVVNGKSIEANFGDFKKIDEIFEPFNIVITAGSYKLEIKYKKILFK